MQTGSHDWLIKAGKTSHRSSPPVIHVLHIHATGYFHLLKWKEANNSALAQAARRQKVYTHTQTKVLGLFWQAASLLFCFMGLGGGGGCFAVLPVIRRLCLWACEKGSTSKINTSSTQISSRVWRVCGEMSWAEDTLLVMDLTWTWPPASQYVMDVLFNLPVFVNLLLAKGLVILSPWVDETTSPVWPLDSDEV